MSYMCGVNSFDMEDITELTPEYPELSGDEETFYFKIVEEEEEVVATEETSESNPTPTVDEEIVYPTDITSFHQINSADGVEIVEDNEESDVESPSEEIIDSEKQNSNISADNQKENTENIESVIQNNIYDISSDSDENTETRQIAPIVNLKAVRFIKNRKRAFPVYYQTEIFTQLIQFLSYKNVDHVVNPLIDTTNGYKLRVKDVMTLLTPRTWLNDAVIQNYISLLVNYCNDTKAMSTDFLNSYKQFGYNSVIKWFQKYDLNNFNRIVVPINPDKIHWALFVVEIWEGKIYCFDSYREPSYMDELSLLSEFLSLAIIDYINFSGVQRTAPKYWTYTDGESPLQSNTYDCGVFTCLNARYFLLNSPPSVKFTQKNIPILRQIIASELINMTLETF